MKKAENTGGISEAVRQSELRHSIECYQKAEEIFELKTNEDEEKGFYPWMFGTGPADLKESAEPKDSTERWRIFKKAARDKLVIKSIYRRIANAAADAGMKELYDEYYPRSL